MKLGTQTGSLFNHLMANCSVKDIVPGETGATLLYWTDRRAATVVEVFKKGFYDYIVVQQDIATRVDKNGMSDCQDYEYSRDPKGSTFTFRIGKSGKFESVFFNEDTGRYKKIGVGGLMVGDRREYYDFSF